MYLLLVCWAISAVAGSELHGGGLHFEYGAEYAPSYDNYKVHDYQFDYAVSDPHTGDHKSQWEVKEKGVVRGGYSLLEPDGSTRIVEYIADDHGFRAIVKKLGTSIHPSTVETHGFSTVQEQAAPVIQTVQTVPVVHTVQTVQAEPTIIQKEVPVISQKEEYILQEEPQVNHVEAIQTSLPSQTIVQESKEEVVPIYKSYDGDVSNYANALNAAKLYDGGASNYANALNAPAAYEGHVSNYANVLNAAAQHLEPLSYKAPIEIPHSVEYHGYSGNVAAPIATKGYEFEISNQQSIPTNAYNAYQISNQQYIPHGISTQNQYQSGYSYQVPHKYSAPKVGSYVVNQIAQPKLQPLPLEVSVPKAQGLLNSYQQEIAHPNVYNTNAQPIYTSYEQAPQQSVQVAQQQNLIYAQEPRSSGVSVQYHGVTGNLEDDAAYTNYGQLGSSVQESRASYQVLPKYARSYSVPNVNLISSHVPCVKPLPYKTVVAHHILH